MIDVRCYGNKTEWTLDGELHREDGPAIVWKKSSTDRYATKEWWLHGVPHREDGPAVIFGDGSKQWFLRGKELTEQEFIAYTRKNKLELVT